MLNILLEILEKLLKEFSEEGYKFIPVGELIYSENIILIKMVFNLENNSNLYLKSNDFMYYNGNMYLWGLLYFGIS